MFRPDKPLLRRVVAAAAVVAVILGAGCEGAFFSAARETDTPEAYLRYLARNPEGDHVEQARHRLKVVRYRRARAVDSPFAYHQFLNKHPEGRLADACRRRLARLALDRARTAADLRLILERYPRTKAAASARDRLPELEAEQAMASGDTDQLRDFLRRYPSSRRAAKVRRVLAAKVFARLGPDRTALERFARDYAGTDEATTAQERARRLLELEIRASEDPALLREYTARYPGHSGLDDLRQVVKRGRVTRWLARLDPARVDEPVLADDPAARWCSRRKAACHKLARLARDAASWRPPVSLDDLKKRVLHPNLALNWKALASLAWMPDPDAGVLLLEQVGAARFSLVWVAARSFRRWWGLFAGKPRTGRFVTRAVRAADAVNADAVQRLGYFALVSGRPVKLDATLRSLWAGDGDLRSSAKGRVLAAAYLEAVARPAAGASAEAVEAFARQAESRLAWLKQAFPADLKPESLPTAQLAERELFALAGATEEVAKLAGAPRGLATLRAEMTRQLTSWRTRLAAVEQPMPPPRLDDLSATVRRHNLGRPAALNALLRHRTETGRRVGQAICRLDPLPMCPRPTAASAATSAR